MPRVPLIIREAVPADSDELLRMWSELGTGIVAISAQSEAARAVARVADSGIERLVVGEVDGRIVAVIHMRRGPMSPLHVEEAVHTSFLLVRPEYRRHGYARALLDVSVNWAEELSIEYVTALTTAASRDSNRFLARLGLGSAAMMRIAPVGVLRSRLSPVPRAAAVTRVQVLAQRRSMRRRQAIR